MRRLKRWQEAGEQAQQGQERADVKYVLDTGFVCQPTENGGADSTHAEGKTEEKAGDQTDLTRDQFLRINEDGGKGGGDDNAYTEGQDRSPEKIDVW